MEKKSTSQVLRQIIREELIKVVRQEMPKILRESLTKPTTSEPTRIKESLKSDFPLTLNSYPQIKKQDVKFKKSNNPLTNLLNETAMTMMEDNNSMHFTTDDVMQGMHPSMAFQPKEAAVGSINDMLSTARPSSNIDAVQINAVPDYSAMMEKMGL